MDARRWGRSPSPTSARVRASLDGGFGTTAPARRRRHSGATASTSALRRHCVDVGTLRCQHFDVKPQVPTARHPEVPHQQSDVRTPVPTVQRPEFRRHHFNISTRSPFGRPLCGVGDFLTTTRAPRQGALVVSRDFPFSCAKACPASSCAKALPTRPASGDAGTSRSRYQ